MKEGIQVSTEIKKSTMLAAMKKHLGIVKTACETANVARSTHYEWIETDPDYKSEVENITEGAIDFVESKLFERINGVSLAKHSKDGIIVYETPPDVASIIFYLKTKAKHRGYVERQQYDLMNSNLVIDFRDAE
jgi:hypothetical protein